MTQKSPEQSRTAIFAGSFRPFTIGHLDILRRGLTLFSHIIVVRGVNTSKAAAPCPEQDLNAALSNIPGVEVVEWDGLTSDLARQRGVSTLLRGVRSVADFEYERSMADANRALFGLETVLLLASPQLAWVSSSLVRELFAFHHDISHLLPPEH